MRFPVITARGLGAIMGGILALHATVTIDQAMAQTPVETYFLPMGETALLESMKKVNYRASSPLNSMQSVTTAADGTVIWYDHWEDGFEPDIISPQKTTTLIWGDGDASNGCAPARGSQTVRPPGGCSDTEDILYAGTAIILENNVPISSTSGRDSSVILYDGGDRVQASFPIAITRGVHSGGSPGALLGGAVETVNTKSWGTSFIAPVGTGMPDDSTLAYTMTDLYVQAAEDNTAVTTDNGNYDVTLPDGSLQAGLSGPLTYTLNMGETLRISKTRVGDKLTSTKPVQAALVTGDLAFSYEMRWYSLLPNTQWSNEYYTPVGDGNSRAWFFNNNTSSITVDVYTKDATSTPLTSVTVPANGHAKYDFIDSSKREEEETGYRFNSASTFYGITQTDIVYSGQRNDWGHPLIPGTSLTSKVVVGLAYGCKNNACPDGTQLPPNPVWLTPAEDAIITINYNADGTDVETVNVPKLGMLNIQGRDPELDMTGAIITANAAGGSSGAGVDIAVAWGQKHDDTLAETYNLDMGTVINPLPAISALKTCSLTGDTDNSTNVSPGDTLKCCIRVTNTGQETLSTLKFVEVESPYTTYACNSATHGTDPPVSLSDAGTCKNPLTAVLEVNVDLSPGGADQICYEIVIDDLEAIPNGVDTLESSDTHIL